MPNANAECRMTNAEMPNDEPNRSLIGDQFRHSAFGIRN
jgi:hypothetical protein